MLYIFINSCFFLFFSFLSSFHVQMFCLPELFWNRFFDDVNIVLSNFLTFFVKTNGGFVFSYFFVCLGGGLSFHVVLICQFNVILRFLLKIMSISGYFVLCLKLSVKNTIRAVFLFIQLNEITYDPNWQFLPFYKTCLFKICFLTTVR